MTVYVGNEDTLLLERVSLQDYPLATCNDGTSAVYYRHLESQLPESKKMLIYLKGGGQCAPIAGYGCEHRCQNNPSLCSAATASCVSAYPNTCYFGSG